MHRMRTHRCRRLRRLAGLMVAAPPHLNNLWARLCRVSGTDEQRFPAGGIPGLTAIVRLWLSCSGAVLIREFCVAWTRRVQVPHYNCHHSMFSSRALSRAQGCGSCIRVMLATSGDTINPTEKNRGTLGQTTTQMSLSPKTQPFGGDHHRFMARLRSSTVSVTMHCGCCRSDSGG